MRGRWGGVVLVALVLIFAALAQSQPGHGVLRDLGLYKSPDAYTELTFTAPDGLPNAIAKKTSKVSVSFDIHNVSVSPRGYQWSIAVVAAGKSQVKASGSATVGAHGRTTVTPSVRVTCTGTQVEVVVALASPAESINFRATCPATRKPTAAKRAK